MGLMQQMNPGASPWPAKLYFRSSLIVCSMCWMAAVVFAGRQAACRAMGELHSMPCRAVLFLTTMARLQAETSPWIRCKRAVVFCCLHGTLCSPAVCHHLVLKHPPVPALFSTKLIPFPPAAVICAHVDQEHSLGAEHCVEKDWASPRHKNVPQGFTTLT